MDVTDAAAANRQRIVGFADVIRIPLRRWRIVLSVTAIVLLAVLGYLFFFPATYTATTVVVLRPVVTDPFTYPSSGADRAINMTAENGVALGNDVIDNTAKVLGQDPDDVRDALSVEVPTGGQVLRFQFADTAEDKAVLGANESANTYLKVRQTIYEKQREGLLVSYDATIRQVNDQRAAAQKGLPSSAGSAANLPPRTQAVLDQVGALNDQIAQLANQRAKIASADLKPGEITAAARTPVPSSHDAWVLFLLGGLLGGALLGMIAAHAREALDRRIRSLDQAADLIGVPGLGVVRSAGRHSEEAAAADARYVSLAVLKWIDRHPDRPLVVLSGRGDEGRVAVSGNLAVALAESGQDVWLAAPPESQDELRKVLFAAQTRTPPRNRAVPLTNESRANGSAVGNRPATPGVVRMTNQPGRVAVKTTAPQDPEATLIMQAPGSAPVITPATPRGPAEPTGDDRRSMVVLIGAGVVRLGTLGEQPDEGVVVIDAPPSDTDERGVRAAQAGVAILVVARDRTRNRELTRLVDRLRSAGAQTVGFVMTGGKDA